MKIKAVRISDDTNTSRMSTFDIEVPDVHNYILANGCVSHNSSISSGTTNSMYAIRELSLLKTNDTNSVSFVVPDSEKLGPYYEIAWKIPTLDMIHCYAIAQKWTDQAISADEWKESIGDVQRDSTELLDGFFNRVKYGLKGKYYTNVRTAKGINLNSSEQVPEIFVDNNSDDAIECDNCKM